MFYPLVLVHDVLSVILRVLRVLVHDVLSVSLSHTRFRPKGVLVIARRGFLRRFGPKILHFEVVFLSLKV